MIEIIDPRKSAVGSIKQVYEKYPHIGNVLPAMGYSPKQIKELEETINNSNAEVVISATPIDISKLIKINKPIVRVHYEFKPDSEFYEELENFIENFI